ncbi:MAG: tetratricopeptide repeat protein [Verrucomicrobiota bacterium]
MMASPLLQPPETHHVSAAVGWLELGNPAEAHLDLDRVSSKWRLHPEVLEVRWQIFAKTQEWAKCIEVAREFAKVAPEEPRGWINLSFALHELKRTQEAHENLTGVLERFPDEWLMRYNLACYACQLGHLEEANRWLAGAGLKGDAKQIKRMAKKDPDLEPLFKASKE